MATELRTGLGNLPDEEALARMRERNQTRKRIETCPTCGSTFRQIKTMFEFERVIGDWLRDNNAAPFDSCIRCVEKHVGRALVLWEEIFTAEGSGTADGDARVDVVKNHLKIIGHLGNAVDESVEYSELHQALKRAERQYRYCGQAPDWNELCELIAAVKTELTNQED